MTDTSIAIQPRIWRFSGFDQSGKLIAFEFPAPTEVSDPHSFQATRIIGRDEGSHFIIDHPAISRYHAQLHYFPEQGLGVCDLNSSNGTYVNGEQIGSDYILLQTGSVVTLADCALTVSFMR